MLRGDGQESIVGYSPHCGMPVSSQEEWDQHIPECSRSMGHR